MLAFRSETKKQKLGKQKTVRRLEAYDFQVGERKVE